MATSTMTATNHFNNTTSSSSATTASQSQSDLTSRLKQMQLKERHPNSGEAKIPRRQPTIVCEDIADDIDFEDETFGSEETIGQESEQRNSGITRSASTASLTVPQPIVEGEDEKRRPPLPADEQMSIESN